MNEIKYMLLKTLDNANEPMTGTTLINKLNAYGVNAVEKHFTDLIRQGRITGNPSSSLNEVVAVETPGRDYIDYYEYRNKYDKLFEQKLSASERDSRFSKIVAIISAAIAFISAAAGVVATFFVN